MTGSKHDITYVQERWYALARNLPPSEHQQAWQIYVGAVAVGYAVGTSADNTQDLRDILTWLSATNPPEPQP